MNLCCGTGMAPRTQQAGIDSRQSRQRPSIELIILSATLPDQSHVARMGHDHFVAQLGQLPAYPGGMGPGFQCDSTSRDLAENLVHSFRRRWQAVLQNYVTCLIQNTVMASSVSPPGPHGHYRSIENFFAALRHSVI